MSRANDSRELVRNCLIGLVLVLGTLACYWPMLHSEFVNYDDPDYVYQNGMVRQGITGSGAVWAFKSTAIGNWHPLTWLSHMLDWQVWGLDARGHHLTNLTLHTANVLLLFLALRRMTGVTWRSGFVAAVFGWHPMHVESVAWIAERKDVLSAFFFMLTIWAYARYVEGQSLKSKVRSREARSGSQKPGVRRQKSEPGIAQPATRTPQHASAYYLPSLLFFACGLMSKPMLVTLPLVLLLLDYWPLQRLELKTQGSRLKTLLPLLREKVPFFALALASSLATFWAQNSGGAIQSLKELPLLPRVENSVIACANYVVRLFWPSHLAFFYPYAGPFSWWQVAGATGLLVAVTLAVTWQAGRFPYLCVGWSWFVGMLIPVIGLVQAGVQARADRYTYLPYVGLSILVAWGLPALVGAWRWARVALAGAGGLALAGCLIGTRTQVQYWRDSTTLCEHALAAVPGNYVAHNNLGVVLLDQGELTQAKRHFAEAVHLRPDYGDAHRNLGSVLAKEGSLDEAVVQYQEALRFCPGFTPASIDLGKVYLRQGKLDEAVAMFIGVIGLKPNSAPAHCGLGLAYALKDRLSECAAEFKTAAELAPADAYSRGQLAIALVKLGQPREAIVQFQEAVRLTPDAPLYLRPLAWVYATHPAAGVRDGAEAVRLAERACVLTRRQDGACLDTLGAAYAEVGRFQDAIRTAEEARAVAAAAGDNASAEAAAQKLGLYHAGKPYRDQAAVR